MPQERLPYGSIPEEMLTILRAHNGAMMSNDLCRAVSSNLNIPYTYAAVTLWRLRQRGIINRRYPKGLRTRDPYPVYLSKHAAR